jgi:hypothetical protein
MAGYMLLVVIRLLSHSEAERHYRHLHYLVGLAMLGLMLRIAPEIASRFVFNMLSIPLFAR